MTDSIVALDGSALFAILLDEPEASRCRAAMQAAQRMIISAGSLTELLVVAAGKNVSDIMDALLDLVRPEIISLTSARARTAADAYRRWGKGFHPAGLNLCDSFAYALAKEHGCPLLFVGNDFAKTDVASAL